MADYVAFTIDIKTNLRIKTITRERNEIQEFSMILLFVQRNIVHLTINVERNNNMKFKLNNKKRESKITFRR